MNKFTAAAGSSLFFASAPGVVAGVVPWGLTGWDAEPASAPAQVLGVALIAAGAAVLLHAFARFVREGVGTPAPIAPTQHLVVGGLYRWIRNPMYVAVVTCVMGQALLLSREVLWVYALGLMALFFAFVRGYEEPTLSRQFGSEYEAYRRAVPGWRPRARPARLPREMS
jgi:protein-S-isoprenylcysteine O-methyltransferase Ste14